MAERDLEVVEWVAKQVRTRVKLGSALDTLPPLLAPDEGVLCAASGFLAGRTGLLVATDRRLLFIRGKDVALDDDYVEIRRFRARSGLTANELYVEDKYGVQLIKQIFPRQRLRELADILGAPPRRPAYTAPPEIDLSAEVEAWHSTSVRIIPDPADAGPDSVVHVGDEEMSEPDEELNEPDEKIIELEVRITEPDVVELTREPEPAEDPESSHPSVLVFVRPGDDWPAQNLQISAMSTDQPWFRQVSQCTMSSTGGRSAGLKSTPLV